MQIKWWEDVSDIYGQRTSTIAFSNLGYPQPVYVLHKAPRIQSLIQKLLSV